MGTKHTTLAIFYATAGLATLAISQRASADGTAPCNDGAAFLRSTECGSMSTTGTAGVALAVGNTSQATADGSTAVGADSSALGGGATAVGRAARALFSAGTSLGNNAFSAATGAVAIGADTISQGTASIAIGGDLDGNGSGAHTSAVGGIALGADSSVTFGSLGGISLGASATVTNTAGIAVGYGAGASGYGAIAIGGDIGIDLVGARAASLQSVAIGAESSVTSDAIGGTAIGALATVSNVAGVALGNGAEASGVYSVALGAGSSAVGQNSVALGTNSEAPEENIVSVGSALVQRRVTNVAAGVNATDAVNFGQLSALQASQASLSTSVDTLFDLRNRDRRDMKQGVASAMAMAQAPMPSAPGKVAYAVNGATFRGEYAVGGSLQYRLNTEAPMAVNVGVSHAGGKNTGVRVGVAGEF